MDIRANLEIIFERINKAALAAGRSPRDITLVAATKTNSSEAIRQAVAAGVPVCGENRVQEMLEKVAENAYSGAKLHFIGHLQKNKVRQVVGICDLIESVDSLELLELISGQALKLNICQNVLIEINIGAEDSKSGIPPAALPGFLEAASALPGIQIRGLMAIPPICEATGGNRWYFAQMYELYVDNSSKKYDNVSMDFLSMGMSGDFEDAIAEGSNMIRLGSAIFGARGYPLK